MDAPAAPLAVAVHRGYPEPGPLTHPSGPAASVLRRVVPARITDRDENDRRRPFACQVLLFGSSDSGETDPPALPDDRGPARPGGSSSTGPLPKNPEAKDEIGMSE